MADQQTKHELKRIDLTAEVKDENGIPIKWPKNILRGGEVVGIVADLTIRDACVEALNCYREKVDPRNPSAMVRAEDSIMTVHALGERVRTAVDSLEVSDEDLAILRGGIALSLRFGTLTLGDILTVFKNPEKVALVEAKAPENGKE